MVKRIACIIAVVFFATTVPVIAAKEGKTGPDPNQAAYEHANENAKFKRAEDLKDKEVKDAEKKAEKEKKRLEKEAKKEAKKKEKEAKEAAKKAEKEKKRLEKEAKKVKEGLLQ